MSSDNLHIREEIVRPRVRIKIWRQPQLKHFHISTGRHEEKAFPLARPKYTAAPKPIEATARSVRMRLIYPDD
jgi:hypothetical protein